jgi:hypothetical protein
MSETTMYQAGDHLFNLQDIGYIRLSLEDYRKLIENSKFVCIECGRAVLNEIHLCRPEDQVNEAAPVLWVL